MSAVLGQLIAVRVLRVGIALLEGEQRMRRNTKKLGFWGCLIALMSIPFTVIAALVKDKW